MGKWCNWFPKCLLTLYNCVTVKIEMMPPDAAAILALQSEIAPSAYEICVHALARTHAHLFFHSVHSNKEQCRPRSLQTMSRGANSLTAKMLVVVEALLKESLMAILTLAS